MNLLYTITTYPPSIGGGQFYTHQLAKSLAVDHTVQIASLWDSNRTDWLLGTTLRANNKAYDYEYEGIPVHRMGFSALEKAVMLPAVLAYYPLMDLALPYLAVFTRRHLLTLAGNTDLVHHVRIGREPLSMATLQIARQKGIPFILTPLHHPRWRGYLYRHLHQLYHQADAIIALTQAEKEILIGFGVREERISITGMGPILAESSYPVDFRQKYSLGDDPIILFLGQKLWYKGVSALLNSARMVWQRFPTAHFLFIGPRTDDSMKLFKAVSDRRILELGSVSLQEKTDALAACTLLCVPSMQESFGGVYTEAWSLGKPVIGCNIPAVSELIDDGVNGFLVRQEPQVIADRVNILLSDSNLAQQMGTTGRAKVNERYTWEHLSGLTEQIYMDVISGADL